MEQTKIIDTLETYQAFIMQSKHVKETFLLLTRVRSSTGGFADLPRSVLDAAEFY